MAAPTVTRPPTTENEMDLHAPHSYNAEQWATVAKWSVLSAVVLLIGSLITVAVITYQQNEREALALQQWDLVAKAVENKDEGKDQDTPAARQRKIKALEGVAEQVKGSPACAFVLMELGGNWMDNALDVTLQPEERASALKKAKEFFMTVATQEPYASNTFFGPEAIGQAALAMEQGKEYDEAIKFLTDSLEKKSVTSYFGFNRLQAQLGRIYWLRAQTKSENDAAQDLKLANDNLSSALTNSTSKENESAGFEWRREAQYIKSLIDPAGKALPKGIAPPMKAAAETTTVPQMNLPITLSPKAAVPAPAVKVQAPVAVPAVPATKAPLAVPAAPVAVPVAPAKTTK